MPIDKDDEEKIYNLREKLLIIYKAASSDNQKRRVSKDLNLIENIIKDIENGKDVDLSKLNIFSNDKKELNKKETVDDHLNYITKVEMIKMAEDHNDSELNEIYSFYIYFERNFFIPLQDNYLKIDYQYSKRRDVIFTHHDTLMHLFEEYINDYEVLKELKIKEQINTFKNRVEQQKAYLLIKLGEFLLELKNLLTELIASYNLGKNIFYNPDESFTPKFDKDRNDFENYKMKEIVQEAIYFLDDFIEIVRIPDFKKKRK
jgi:hypothetical protein